MSYYLNFYSMTPAQLERLPPDTGSVTSFIRENGAPIGEMHFSAGDAWFFFDELEQALELPFGRLLEGPVGVVDPPEEPPFFGGLPNATALLAIDELKSLLQHDDRAELEPNIAGIADELGWTADTTRDHISQLRILLEKASSDGRDAATVYE